MKIAFGCCDAAQSIWASFFDVDEILLNDKQIRNELNAPQRHDSSFNSNLLANQKQKKIQITKATGQRKTNNN